MTDEETKMYLEEDAARKQIYSDCSKIGLERLMGRAKSTACDVYAYGFPLVHDDELFIVRLSEDALGGLSFKLVSCKPSTLQMKVNVGGWNLWEGDVLETTYPGCEPEYGVLVWDGYEHGEWMLQRIEITQYEKTGHVVAKTNSNMCPFIDIAFDDKADIRIVSNWSECEPYGDGGIDASGWAN